MDKKKMTILIYGEFFMKRYLAAALIVVMALGMTGCGKRAVEAETESVYEATIAASEEDASAKASSIIEEAAEEESIEEESPAAATTASTEEAATVASTAAPAEPAPEPVEAVPEPAEAAPVAEQAPTVDYGRIIFAGDSRTVDMFDSEKKEIWDGTYDGIRVFCKHGCHSDYMFNAVYAVGYDNFDTLISWMGCNDYGDFSIYRGFYEEVLAQGKHLILCTVGPTNDATLEGEFDRIYYTNDRQVAFNASLQDWAAQHGVKVIRLYDYINTEIANGNIYIDPQDGIHYQPQPTTAIWRKILSSIN